MMYICRRKALNQEFKFTISVATITLVMELMK